MAAEELSYADQPVPAFQRASQHPLDSVRDCADLAGAFPAIVQFNSILFKHGDTRKMTADETRANAARLAPYCLGADHIAIEIGVAREPENLLADFNALNATLQTGQAVELELYNPWIAHMILGIVDGLDTLDQENTPVFFPIDAWEDPALAADIADFFKALRSDEPGIALRYADTMRRREALVLRQLHRYASEADDGTVQRIAVVQGSMHGLTAVGLHGLGARVQRTFIDRTSLSPIETIVHMIRMHRPEQIDHEQVEVYEYAERLAEYLLQQSRDILMPVDEHTSPYDREMIHAKLGIVCLRGHIQNLPALMQEAFNAFERALTADAPIPLLNARSRQLVAASIDLLRS